MEKPFINSLIMILPHFFIMFTFMWLLRGNSLESIFITLIIIHTIAIYRLSLRLARKEAIAYVLVQYPFLPLMAIMLGIGSYGLAAVLAIPFTYLINMIIVYLYFRFAEDRKRIHDIMILIFTLVLTVLILNGVSYQIILR